MSEATMAHPVYPHIEGMDLAGKTTAAELYVRSQTGVDWQIRQNALNPQNGIYHFADSLRRRSAYDTEVLGCLYAAAVLADIRSFERPTKCTIQESTIVLRSAAIQRVHGNVALADLYESFLEQHPRFDVSVVLTASIEVRLDRLRRRIDEGSMRLSIEDHLVAQDPGMFLAMESELIRMSQQWFGSTVIDTTDLTPDQVLKELVAIFPAGH